MHVSVGLCHSADVMRQRLQSEPFSLSAQEVRSLQPQGVSVLQHPSFAHVFWSQQTTVYDSRKVFVCDVLQVERLLKQIDLNADDGIAYDEWMAAMLTWRTVRLQMAPSHLRCRATHHCCAFVWGCVQR